MLALVHSWGSHHDTADEPKCRSVYLMYEFAQDGSLESQRVCLVDTNQGISGDFDIFSLSFCSFSLSNFHLAVEQALVMHLPTKQCASEVSSLHRSVPSFNYNSASFFLDVPPSVSACFSSLCGNYQVDEGEQCDGGHTTLNGCDPCCTEQCQLTDGSVCRSGKQWACCCHGNKPCGSEVFPLLCVCV